MSKVQLFCGGACRGFVQVVCEGFRVVVSFLGNRVANLCRFFRLDKLSFESLTSQ